MCCFFFELSDFSEKKKYIKHKCVIYFINCWLNQRRKVIWQQKILLRRFFFFIKRFLLGKDLSFSEELYCLLSISMFLLAFNGSVYKNPSQVQPSWLSIIISRNNILILKTVWKNHCYNIIEPSLQNHDIYIT